jgi:hypothetical protein
VIVPVVYPTKSNQRLWQGYNGGNFVSPICGRSRLIELFIFRMFPQRFRTFPQPKHSKRPTEKAILYPQRGRYQPKLKLLVLHSLPLKILAGPVVVTVPNIVGLVAMNISV